MGVLPNGIETNVGRVVTIPAYSHMRLSIHAFGMISNSNSRTVTPLLATGAKITYQKEGFPVFDSWFDPSAMPPIVGPAEVRFSTTFDQTVTLLPGSGFQCVMSYDPAVYPPNKSVIIPTGSAGADLALELSHDLVLWQPAALGTYTAPTNNLFFRLKLNRL